MDVYTRHVSLAAMRASDELAIALPVSSADLSILCEGGAVAYIAAHESPIADLPELSLALLKAEDIKNSDQCSDAALQILLETETSDVLVVALMMTIRMRLSSENCVLLRANNFSVAPGDWRRVGFICLYNENYDIPDDFMSVFKKQEESNGQN